MVPPPARHQTEGGTIEKFGEGRIYTSYGRVPHVQEHDKKETPTHAILPKGRPLVKFGPHTGNEIPPRWEPLEKLGRRGRDSSILPLLMARARGGGAPVLPHVRGIGADT